METKPRNVAVKAARCFARAFVASFLVFFSGLAYAPNWSAWSSLRIAVELATVTATFRVLEHYVLKEKKEE